MDFLSKLATHQASIRHAKKLARVTSNHVRQAWNATHHDLGVDNERFVDHAVAQLMWPVSDALRVKMVEKMAVWKNDTPVVYNSDPDLQEITHEAGAAMLAIFSTPQARGSNSESR